jgi:soluble lytic murein transglycosylase-like protein
MKTILKGFVLLFTLLSVVGVAVLQANLVAPVKRSQDRLVTAQKMQNLGFPKKLATSVVFAAQRTNLEPDFVVALICSESNFDIKAVSSKGYYGLLQIPHRITDPDANILIGCQIFRDKLRITNNDTRNALVLYKGWKIGDRRGEQQADKVLSLYHKIKRII